MFILALLAHASICVSFGVTVEELRADPAMTPERFARHFGKFKFQFRAAIQSPKAFLESRSGDCDDYATLAADILKSHGYTPRLITVRMKKIVHVVCYIEETRSYLDFNQRHSSQPAVPSGGSLSEIARRVAASFNDSWTSASEFTFEQRSKRLVKTVTYAQLARAKIL